MGRFRKSSYAYLLFKNRTILTTITSTATIHKGNAITGIVNAKKHLHYFCLLHPKGKVSPVLKGLESSFWGQIGVQFDFQSTGADLPPPIGSKTSIRSKTFRVSELIKLRNMEKSQLCLSRMCAAVH